MALVELSAKPRNRRTLGMDDELLMPTMRFRWVEADMTDASVENVLQQFWVHSIGSESPGKWITVPHAGHVTTAPRNTLQ